MIPTAKIKAMAGYTSYSRGLDIYNLDRFLDFEVQLDGEYDEVWALVKGSGRNRYQLKPTIHILNRVSV